MHAVISERVKLTIIQKKKRQRGHIERKLREMVRVGGDICSALKDCSNENATTILNIIRMDVVGKCIVHVWYDREQNVDVIWNGRVMHVENDLVSKDPLLVINY